MRRHVLLGLSCAMLLVAPARAQLAGDRDGSWEAGFHLTDSSSFFVADSFGASLDVEDVLGYGFSGSYNFSNHFALMLDYSWSGPDYLATFIPDGPGSDVTIATRLDVTTLQAKGTYYFLDGAITPFVELGVGWTNIDSNILSRAPITGCWWDPFWGYVCERYYETYNQTELSYSAGIGVRWDFSEEFMLRAGIGMLGLDLDGAEDPSTDTVQFDFAWRF